MHVEERALPRNWADVFSQFVAFVSLDDYVHSDVIKYS